jgi:c-di-GMP-binding flagellar brake protein YcgR
MVKDAMTRNLRYRDPAPEIREIHDLDRRRHPRLTVDLPVKCGGIDDEPERYGRTVNASEGGLLVLFPEEVEVGRKLPMQLFYVMGSELNILEATVRVTWRRSQLRNNQVRNYRTGLTFLDVSPEDSAKLKSLVGNLSKKESSFS